ncbi:Thrombospondin type-1 domain-containing protein 4 [Labeo rohita]|uniref:Thrombospondin type-1 domain-containing protein 4 n=1 Tax=Labeo rohita TaxID=84645 RepID=A0ABQ8N0V6_LABRO|nr:Thrombospondin type-1 domain-containing protein 4 [Labeo rohita]
MACGMQMSTWSGHHWRLIQHFLQMTLLLSLLCPPTEPVPWDSGSSSSPEEGCEGFQVDVCGVCAGDGSSCELFSGTLFLSVLSVGYHKILDIPSGAQRIKIQETQKTRNYLALRTATGESVINGDWVIDRPGQFYAVGTELTYKRPNEIRSRAGESITATGPTNQELHLFVRDSYLESHGIFPDPDNNDSENSLSSSNANQVPSDSITPEPVSLYSWLAITTTPCSATCGTGSRQVLFGCVERATQTTVPGDLCSYSSHPGPQVEECQSQPCPAFWDVGEWSECSKTCGPGFQYRQVICQQAQGQHGNSTVVVANSLCDNTEMPETTTVCQLKICSEWQIRSEWTERTREVVCVDNLGDIVVDEECNMALRPLDLQNCDKGVCASSWFYSLWSDRCSADCAEGSRSRTVVCMMSHTNSLPLDNCDDEDKPDDLMPCDLGPCTQRLEWYAGPWGQCSRSCDGGFRVREVRCLQDDLTTSNDCDPALEPANKEECNTHTCTTPIGMIFLLFKNTFSSSGGVIHFTHPK